MHWSALGERAHFNLTSTPTGLHIIRVEPQDHGEYRCRVDFRRSPTRNLQVKLLVVGKCPEPRGRWRVCFISPFLFPSCCVLSCPLF
ncbi:hypothetical protein E2C01_087787 [Portunus trituberculatus]|uniref:Ig-like domain-containing protein n=1 Tax=Portunus trituberculatus TaxID=210409 RepID=A0A5B7JEA5_PORTR|nr:hypothetical protein [Portunus trituberculatus]